MQTKCDGKRDANRSRLDLGTTVCKTKMVNENNSSYLIYQVGVVHTILFLRIEEVLWMGGWIDR